MDAKPIPPVTPILPGQPATPPMPADFQGNAPYVLGSQPDAEEDIEYEKPTADPGSVMEPITKDGTTDAA